MEIIDQSPQQNAILRLHPTELKLSIISANVTRPFGVNFSAQQMSQGMAHPLDEAQKVFSYLEDLLEFATHTYDPPPNAMVVTITTSVQTEVSEPDRYIASMVNNHHADLPWEHHPSLAHSVLFGLSQPRSLYSSPQVEQQLPDDQAESNSIFGSDSEYDCDLDYYDCEIEDCEECYDSGYESSWSNSDPLDNMGSESEEEIESFLVVEMEDLE